MRFWRFFTVGVFEGCHFLQSARVPLFLFELELFTLGVFLDAVFLGDFFFRLAFFFGVFFFEDFFVARLDDVFIFFFFAISSSYHNGQQAISSGLTTRPSCVLPVAARQIIRHHSGELYTQDKRMSLAWS